MAVASAGPYASLHLAPDRQPCQHPTTQFFTGRMPFLTPNQQHQSTEGITQHSTTELYILCWSEHKLSPTLATVHYSSPDNAIGLVAQCELSGYDKLEAVGRKFSHRPGNPATGGVVRWSSTGNTVGYRLHRPKLTAISLISMHSTGYHKLLWWRDILAVFDTIMKISN